MKKILIPILAAALFTTGCKTGAKKNSDGTVSVTSETDANNIISYTNDVVDVLKKYSDHVEDKVSYYDDLEKNWNDGSTYLRFGGLDNLWTMKKQADHAFGAVPDALGDDKAFFKDSVSAYNRLFKQFSSQDSALELYVKAEDFKDDKYVKGKELLAKQFEIYPQMMSLHSSISKRIQTVADAAEEVILKDSPIKDAYKSTKSDLASFKKLGDQIADKEQYTDAEIAAIETAYTTLNATVAKNAAVDKAMLTKESKADEYKSFYEDLAEKLNGIKPVIRNIKTTKKLSKDDYNDVDQAYSFMIDSYNRWVN